MKTIEIIEYRGFEITLKKCNSRVGVAYSATNNYGEPYTTGRFFKNPEDAINNEKKNLDLCLDQ